MILLYRKTATERHEALEITHIYRHYLVDIFAEKEVCRGAKILYPGSSVTFASETLKEKTAYSPQTGRKLLLS